MIASQLILNESNMKILGMVDDYSVHRIVYDLFEDIRDATAKNRGEESGFLYMDKGGEVENRTILLLSHRSPKQPKYGVLHTREVPQSFLTHERYGFEVLINPSYRSHSTSKIVPVRGHEEIIQWFITKADASWGFSAITVELKRKLIKKFVKSGNKVTIGGVLVTGELIVKDRERFIRSFQQGLGRGKAWGFGLLQLVPILKH